MTPESRRNPFPPDERELWEDAPILGGPPGFWESEDPISEKQARDLLVNAVGTHADVVAKMTADEAVALLSNFRDLIRRLTASRATDQLTGAMVRGAGYAALRREIARITRSGGSLVLAFVDVDGLKEVNDSRGHAAGDELLRQVVRALRRHLRSYDLVIRVGGDEFLCVLGDTDLREVRERFREVGQLLARRTGGGSISVGLAEHRPGEGVDSLVRRADEDMYGRRRRRASSA